MIRKLYGMGQKNTVDKNVLIFTNVNLIKNITIHYLECQISMFLCFLSDSCG